MATEDSNWPLPTQSRRVRGLLYLAEGMVIGAATTYFLLPLFGAFLIDIETGSFTPAISPLDIVFILFVLFFLLRARVIIGVDRRYSSDQPAQTEYQDWRETRRWLWVATVALASGGALFGVSILLWDWWEIVYLVNAHLLVLSTLLAGITLYLYVFHRLGMKVI